MVVLLVGGLILDGYACAKGLWIFENAAFAGLGFAIVALLVSVMSALELGKLASGKNIQIFRMPIIIGLIILLMLPFHLENPFEHMYIAVLLMLVFFLAAVRQAVLFKSEGAIANISSTIFTFVYIGFGAYFLIKIRLMGFYSDTIAKQSGFIVTFLAVVKGTDIGAYLIGRKFGKTKIVPSISPGKSWQGLAGGLVFSSAIAVGFGTFAFSLLSIGEAIVFGSILTFYGQFGDLVESMFKRDAGLKDSASLIPEFGGFLDLIDSPFFAAPLGWVLFQGMTDSGGWRSLLL